MPLLGFTPTTMRPDNLTISNAEHCHQSSEETLLLIKKQFCVNATVHVVKESEYGVNKWDTYIYLYVI